MVFIVSLAASPAVYAYDPIGPACPATPPATQTVSFVHVGDLHANFDLVEGDKFSKIRAFLNTVRSANPFTIFTNAGDDHEKGSVAEQYSRGEAVTQATYAMQFDVRTIGNHDFAWGVEHLLAFSRDPHSMVLSSNTHYDVSGPDPLGLGSVDYGVLQVGCLKIGFFGMVGPSWNELDKQTYVDYLPFLHTTLYTSGYISVAQSIVNAHRSEVDLMVMVSHLGYGVDQDVAAAVPGIDLVLGGHTHTGPQQTTINNTLVVEPDCYADGVTRVDLTVDLVTHGVTTAYQEQPVADLTDIDPTMHQAISDILTQYAPDAQKTIAYLKNAQNNYSDPTHSAMAKIAANAAVQVYAADAALLDPARADPWGSWSSGAVTVQDLIDGYFIERQRPNTPGINSLYMVEVSGEDLQLMTAQTPSWVYSGPVTPNAGSTYKVIVHKAAALDPTAFFTGVTFPSFTYLSEAWETLAQYGINRTAQCLYLDVDSPQLSNSQCKAANSVNGVCGTASGSSFTALPTNNLCNSGTIGTISGNGPWTWSCVGGTGGTTDSSCFANKMTDGVCGASNAGIFTSAPTSDLCDAGNTGAISGSGPWTWSCTGLNGGKNDACLAYIQTWTVTPSSGSHGSISPSVPQTVNSNGTVIFTLTPDTGYHVNQASGCGGSLAGNTYTTGAITANCTVTASFAMNSYTIAASAGANGSISSAGTTTVTYGANMSYTITPLTGYHVLDVLVDGSSVGAVTSYSFTNVTANHTIAASFEINTYTVTPSVGANGIVNPNTAQVVSYNGTTSFIVTPDTGYGISSITGCNGSLSGSTYTTGAVTTDCTITFVFTISPVNGACGTSNGQTLISAPATNLCSSGTAGLVGGSGPWAWTCIGANGGTTANCSANIQTYIVTPSPGANGSFSPNTAQVVNYNGTASFTITPVTGYHIDLVSGCGGTLAGNIYTTGAVTADCAVTATFAINGTTDGACGTANGGTFTSPPSSNLCSVGTAGTVSGSGPWTWSCTGLNGGATAYCSADILILGDLDSSGDVSVSDALRALRIAAGLIQPTAGDLLRGDVAPLVNSAPQPDGKIDIGDVIVILRKAVGLPSW